MAILRRLLLLLIPFLSYAQSDTSSAIVKMDVLNNEDLNPEYFTGENTFTSANRLPTDINDVPYSAFIITSEQIRTRAYTTLVDVLKDLPGVKVSQPGSALHGETFLMRGLFGNYYVKILVDGLPIQPSATSGMPIGAQLPIQQADRIEVLYGPAAAVYGADAMAGVINIVTKKSEKLQLVDADVSVGLPGHWKFDATIAGKFGRKNRVWNYMFYGGIFQFNNLPITSEAYAEEYDPSNYVPTGEEDIYLNSEYYKGTKTQPEFSFLPEQSQKFGFRFGNQNFNFGIDFGNRTTHSAIGSNPINRLYHNPNTRFGEQIVRVFGSYKSQIGIWTSQTNLQWLTYKINPSSQYITIDNPLNFEGEFYQYGESSDLYLEQLFSASLGKGFSILSGATVQFSGNLPQFDLYTSPVEPSDFGWYSTTAPESHSYLEELGVGPFNFLVLGALIDGNYQSEKWIFNLGIRLDYREFYEAVFNPKIGIVFKPNTKNRIRFTASTAYRPPSSYLINSGVLSYQLNGQSFALPSPNKALGAERLFNAEAGWNVSFSKQHSLDASLFYHVNTNLISRTTSFTVNDGQFNEYYGYVNDANSSAQLFGLVVADRSKFKLGRINYQSDASVQLAKGSEVLPFDRGKLDYYRMQPLVTFKWLLEMEFFEHFNAGIRAHFFSDWRTRSVIVTELEDELVAPAYYKIDLLFRYSFDEGKEIYFMINNVTNVAHYGIGASGGAGTSGGRFVFEDLIYNPQLLRVIKAGLRISIP